MSKPNVKKVSKDAFKKMAKDAGILVTAFNPAAPAEVSDEDIICTTSGGYNITSTPTYTDLFEDVDNAPNNTKEGLVLEGWEHKISFETVNLNEKSIKLALGAVDVVGNKITPADELKDAHFSELWWLVNTMDGGIAAVHISNALSTGGLSIQSGKNSKATNSLEITAYTSIASGASAPMEYYIIDGEE